MLSYLIKLYSFPGLDLAAIEAYLYSWNKELFCVFPTILKSTHYLLSPDLAQQSWFVDSFFKKLHYLFVL